MKTFQEYLTQIEEVGFVEESKQSIAYARGLPNATIQEIVMFETGETGLILSLSPDYAEILLFSKYPVKTGTRVTRTGEKQQMPVGFELLGQVVDSFSNPLSTGKDFVKPKTSRPIDISPSGISDRKRIEKTFETGVTLVDLLVPLGKGQRELIIGDRKTGKTSFLYQTIIKQAKLGTICIYAAIGKKRIDIKKAEEVFKANGVDQNTVIVASGAEDPAGVIYLTPYCAMTLAEYFRDEGHDVLVVMDDLFTHAKFYREIMLIGRRFPGRNAYPADIFYLHARLLERAGNFLLKNNTETSITCLPVVESVEGDIAGFVQTNLMSMTDGHIYFDVDLFSKGRRPAINPFISVSRVGRQTQSSLRLSINRELISFLTIHKQIESFSHFGSETGLETKRILTTAERIFAFFTQSATQVTTTDLQIVLFGLLWMETWQEVDTMQKDIRNIQKTYTENTQAQALVKDIVENSKTLNDMLDILKKRKYDLLSALGAH